MRSRPANDPDRALDAPLTRSRHAIGACRTSSITLPGDDARQRVQPRCQRERTAGRDRRSGRDGRARRDGRPGRSGRASRARFENLELALAAAGATFADIVKFGVFVTDMSILPVVRETRDRHVDPAQPPASTPPGWRPVPPGYSSKSTHSRSCGTRRTFQKARLWIPSASEQTDTPGDPVAPGGRDRLCRYGGDLTSVLPVREAG